MEMFVIGMVFGGVIGFAMFWNRTRRLEDELIEKEILLNETAELLSREKKSKRKEAI